MTLFRFGPYRLDAATRELAEADRVIPLPPRVFDALVFLIERRERAVGREELIDAMWGARGATDVQLAQLVLQCRRAVGDDGHAQQAIRTVAGFGYRWVAPVEIASRDAEPASDSSVRETALAAPRHAQPSRSRAAWLVVAAAVVAIAIGAWFFLTHRPPVSADAARVLVTPVSIDDADVKWLRLGGMDVVVDRLRANRVPVLPSDATVAMLRTVDDRSDDAIASFAHDAGARAIVALRAERANALWHMTATLRDDGAPERSEHVESADPLVALRLLADEVSGALGFPAAEPFRQTGNPAVALTLQQARAALLANETERARALLMANPALVADEPLLQEQLAEIDIRAGRFDDARKALDTLLARTDNTPAFRATLHIARGLAAVRQGRFGDAGDDFSNALDALDSLGADADPIVLGRAYLGRGISRTSLQDYAGAQGDYGRAREAFERAGDPGSVARVDTDIGALENLRGHPAQALPYLERARDRFASLGMIQEEFNVLQLAFVAERMELRNADAAATIDRAWTMRSRVVSPASLLSVGLYRIESLLSLGKLAEADALLAGLAGKGRPAANAEGERHALTRAALLREQGRFEDALAALDGVSEAPHASADDDTVRASVGLLRARLERDLGRAADVPAPAVDDLAAPTPRTPLRLLAAANRAWARDDRTAADRAFGEALALADAQGVASTLAAVAADDVEWLVATGRVVEASAVAARVALWADADFECALTTLRVAVAKREPRAWHEALARARKLAGERAIPTALAQVPD
jgi:DNA-binding winged helix-turn-helix (wHTH) protein/tetratricopeptide (TPR) repeat protein